MNDKPDRLFRYTVSLADLTKAWICTQNPTVPAATDLLNRALDKPVEPVHVTGDGSPIVIRWQSGYDGKEAGQVRELPEGDVDEKIRRARKVNGNVD